VNTPFGVNTVVPTGNSNGPPDSKYVVPGISTNWLT